MSGRMSKDLFECARVLLLVVGVESGVASKFLLKSLGADALEKGCGRCCVRVLLLVAGVDLRVVSKCFDKR